MGFTITPEMMQMMMQMAGSRGASQGAIPGLMGSLMNRGSFQDIAGSLMRGGVNTPGINPDPRAQQQMMGLGMQRPYNSAGAETNSVGQKIGHSAMGSALGVSPEGQAHNQAMYNQAMNPMASGDTSVMAGGLSPKAKMMMMVGQQLFNKSQERPELPTNVGVGANAVNVGSKPAMNPGNFAQGMQMQRGNPIQYSLGGGMLQDPRRQRNQFLFGV